MDKISIIGGNPLRGIIDISGAKNAALPLMTAALLSEEPLTLGNLPHLADIATLAHLLEELGVTVTMIADGAGNAAQSAAGRVLSLDGGTVNSTIADYDLVRKMRASILVLGPLLARFGEAKVSLPGGCAIGSRPVDLHLKGLEAMGAELDLKEGYVHARAPKGLQGAEFHFPFVSVGATENLMMAACLANGTTHLVNAAKEPEITDLAHCLVKMGAKIEGIGTGRLTITGVEKLHAARHDVLPDRIEAGSYACAAIATGGDVVLRGVDQDILISVTDALREAGAIVEAVDGGLRVAAGEKLIGVDASTQPFPGFPTDMQAQYMALMTQAENASMISENVFENRFMHVPELIRMGADIKITGHSALVRGGAKLKGAPVMATDLRASMSLVIAALVAEGETVISRVYHLDRGYERLEDKLSRCGAVIKRIKEDA